MPDQTNANTNAEVGEVLGQTVAAIVIGTMHAAEVGWKHGYLYEHAATHPDTYGEPQRGETPEEFTRLPVHEKTFWGQFEEGRADYRTDNKLPALPA